MSGDFLILACGGPRFSAGEVVFIYSLIGGWMVGLALAVVNPFMICFWDVSRRVKSAHLLTWAVYAGSGLAVWVQGLGHMASQMWLIPIFGVPVLSIAHFVALLWIRKAKKPRMDTDGHEL